MIVSAGCLAGAGHVDRANRVCLVNIVDNVTVLNDRSFECAALAPLGQQHAEFFTT